MVSPISLDSERMRLNAGEPFGRYISFPASSTWVLIGILPALSASCASDRIGEYEALFHIGSRRYVGYNELVFPLGKPLEGGGKECERVEADVDSVATAYFPHHIVIHPRECVSCQADTHRRKLDGDIYSVTPGDVFVARRQTGRGTLPD